VLCEVRDFRFRIEDRANQRGERSQGRRFLAGDVLGRMGIKLTVEGGALPNIKFPRINAMHGESVIDFLDTLARGLSQGKGNLGIAFTSNVQGDFSDRSERRQRSGGRGREHLGRARDHLQSIDGRVRAVNFSGIGKRRETGRQSRSPAVFQRDLRDAGQAIYPGGHYRRNPDDRPAVAAGSRENRIDVGQGDQITVFATV
jgi:hypothetical protein